MFRKILTKKKGRQTKHRKWKSNEKNVQKFFFEKKRKHRNKQNNIYKIKGIHSDIEIHVGNEIFPCHRCILAAMVPAFHSMLSHPMSENKDRIIKIDDTNPQIVTRSTHKQKNTYKKTKQ